MNTVNTFIYVNVTFFTIFLRVLFCLEYLSQQPLICRFKQDLQNIEVSMIYLLSTCMKVPLSNLLICVFIQSANLSLISFIVKYESCLCITNVFDIDLIVMEQ